MNIPAELVVVITATCIVCGPFAVFRLIKALSQGGTYRCEKCGQDHFFRNH